jgi:glycosyltransferase involved in cell wall biosynthesis
MKNLIINGTLFSKGNSGVQRYARNIINNFTPDFNYNLIQAPYKCNNFLHLYEQISFLKYNKTKNIIWTPTHIAPIFIDNNIITVHDLLPIDNEHLFSKAFSNYYKLMLPILLKKSLHIFTVSNFTKSRIIERYNINPDKITISYNGTIFNNKLQYDNNNFKFLLEKFEINKYFLVVGNLGLHKNNLFLINIWKKIKTDVKLIFIGKLPEYFRLNFLNEITTDNRIIHFDNVDDNTLANFYKNTIALIFISLYEGFGIPLIEANSFGTRVIYSQNTVLEEIAGDCNLPVDAKSEFSIINSIKTCLSNDSYNDIPYIKNSNKYLWENESIKVQSKLNEFL